MGKQDWDYQGSWQTEAISRRRFLSLSAAAATGLLVAPAHAAVGLSRRGERILGFHHLHTGESLIRTYWADATYLEDPLADIDHLLRDFRSGDIPHRSEPARPAAPPPAPHGCSRPLPDHLRLSFTQGQCDAA